MPKRGPLGPASYGLSVPNVKAWFVAVPSARLGQESSRSIGVMECWSDGYTPRSTLHYSNLRFFSTPLYVAYRECSYR